MKRKLATFAAVLAAAAVPPAVLAANPLEREGFFAGISAGASSVAAGPIGRIEQDDPRSHAAGRIRGGYWFSPNWGVEAGYTRLGRIEQRYVDGTFRGQGESLHVGGLGRLPFADRWALVGKLTAVTTRVKDDGSTGVSTGYERLKGSSTSLATGVALEYALSERIALTVEAESMGRGGRKLDLGYAGVGLRYAF